MLLSDVVKILGKVDETKGAAEALNNIINASTDADKAAAAARFIAEIAAGAAIYPWVRTLFPSIRLGLAITGNIDKWEAISAAAGIGGGYGAGWLIDEINSLNIGSRLYDYIHPETNTYYTTARTWRRRDPLVLDLDGDGIETVGTNAGILFDHDGDGVATGTGWVKPDDGFLVLDRNGNGTIDNGSELFGVDTILSNGQNASDGFAALKDLDSNQDNVFNASDAKFADVRIWRDLNQNGISDAGELMRLTDAGIVSINLNATSVSASLTGNNTQGLTSTYTKTDGTTAKIANLNFAENTFDRHFLTPVTLTAGAQALPEMKGSGSVRDMRGNKNDEVLKRAV